jgi:DNA-binding SARP family transcriptional activator
MLRVHVIGELTVEVDGRRVDVPAAWRLRSLLAWLALHPGLHPRAALASRFWPDVLDVSARASLRNALWSLRRALGPEAERWVVATRDRVGLADDVWVDAREAARLADAGRLEEAADRAAGELLTGFEEDWVDEARDEHRARLSEIYARLAEGDDGLGWARRRAALDPLAEEPQRELIRLLAEAGERAAALSVYERLRDRLRAEIGIAPSPATRELVAAIRREAPAETAYRPPAPAGDRRPLPPRLDAADGPFAGRAEELARLRSLFERARGGTAGLVLLAGEPGIGKSRLAAELGRELHGGGAHVLYGRCDEEALVPYQPFADALGNVVLGALGGSEEPEGLRRYRLFEAAAGAVESLAAAAPVLLVLDDLQWADSAGVQMLRHVLSSRPAARVLVLGAYRHTELPPDHPLAVVAGDLRRDLPVERIELAGLAEREVGVLVDALAPGGDATGLAGRVHAETGGNPFFVREVLRHLAETGLPEGVRDVVRARLARLREPCQRLLALAAVAGPELDLPLLERAGGIAREELVDAVEEAESAGLLVEAEDRYAFAHALIRETLYEGLAAARRTLLHRRVAEGLEALRGAGPEPPLAELAHHFCRAGDPAVRDRAVDYATRAAEGASALLAHEHAVALYSDALRLLPEGDQRIRALRLRRAVAFQAASHVRIYDAGGRVRAEVQ